MSTGDIFVNIFAKKLMDQEALADHLLDYLRKLVQDSQSTIYASSGFFSPVTLSADTIDSFDVTTFQGQDDVSRILALGASNNVPFENTNAIVYYVAAGYASVPNEAEINPRTALPEYKNTREEVGDVADPDSVTDDGDGTMTIIVDSVTEAGVSNAGRTVKVWLKNPVSAVDWFEDLTVTWDGSNNIISTTGALGQATISTTAADYSVWRSGVTVSRGTDLSAIPSYAFIGTVTGAGIGVIPTTFSTSGQITLASDPNVALNLATIFKDMYKTPTFPDDGNPKFSDPVEFWWEQEHNNSDYTHDDVTFQTLVAKLQTGLQLTIQALDLADESNIKAVFKDNAGANASWIYGSGKFNIIDLQTRDTTVLGTAGTDDLSILASIIADVAINSGGANSPAIKYFASGSLTRPFVMFNQAGELIIGRNDAIVTDAVVKFWNVASATDKINVQVQGTITGFGNIILDGGAATTSPLLQFISNSAGEDWEVGIDSVTGTMTIERNTAGVAILKLVSTATATIETDNLKSTTLEDGFVAAPVPLASASDTSLNTTAQDLVGAINEAFALAGVLPPHNHDDRYYTKSEIGGLTILTGSALVGHVDDDLPTSWEINSVKEFIDALGRMANVVGKVPIPIYYNSSVSHVTVPAQAIIGTGALRWRDTDLNVSWADLDTEGAASVTRQTRHAYYIYLKPVVASTVYDARISDSPPVKGFHTESGKEGWVYVGSFVTDNTGSGNVIPFKRAGNSILLETSDAGKLMTTFASVQVDTIVNLGDNQVGVVPETAVMAIIQTETETRSTSAASTGPVVRLYASAETPAATDASFIDFSRGESINGVTNRCSGSQQGVVGLDNRQFVATLENTGGAIISIASRLYRVGWIEEIYYGKN